MGLFKSKTSFIPRKNRNGTTTAGQYSQYGISQSSNGGTSSQKEDLSDIYKRLEEKLDSNKVGTANGAASLDENGKVPTDQLPSYVDDVVEYETLQDFPSPGETGKIYVATSTNKTYRWSGSQYIDISSASDDCLLKSSKISDNEIGTIVAGGDVTSADNYLNNRGLKLLWSYITDAANGIVISLSALINNKQDAISITTKSDSPTDNDTVIMQANGSNDTKTYLRRKMSDIVSYFKNKFDAQYLRIGAFVQRNNTFGLESEKISISKIDNSLYAADKRFIVTREIFNSDTGEKVTDQSTSSLFDGGYEEAFKHPITGEYELITIKKDEDGSGSLWTYGGGYLYVSFYYTMIPDDNGVSIRWKYKNSTDWNSGTLTKIQTKPNQAVFYYALTGNQLHINTIEIKVQGKTNTEAAHPGVSVTEIEFIRNRATIEQESAIVKYGFAQEMFGNLTAPKFITKGGTATQIHNGDGSLSNNLSIARGGTGATTAIGAEFNILNQVQDIDATLNDNRKIALCNENKSSTNGVFRWLKMSNVWNYIKGKIDSAYSSVLGSGITSSKVSSYDTHLSNNDVHVTSSQKTSWDNKQDAISVTTKSDTPTDNETVIMQANGSNDTKTFLRRKMSDVWTYIKGKIDSAYSSVLGSGITSSKVSSYDTHLSNNDVHVTSSQKTSWDNKQDAISVTTKSDTPTDNETVIMQANGSNDTKTYLRRKMSDVWTYIKGKIDETYAISNIREEIEITNMILDGYRGSNTQSSWVGLNLNDSVLLNGWWIDPGAIWNKWSAASLYYIPIPSKSSKIRINANPEYATYYAAVKEIGTPTNRLSMSLAEGYTDRAYVLKGESVELNIGDDAKFLIYSKSSNGTYNQIPSSIEVYKEGESTTRKVSDDIQELRSLISDISIESKYPDLSVNFGTPSESIRMFGTSDGNSDDSKIINSGQLITINGVHYCFYLGMESNGTNENNYHILSAYSTNGTTWTRGFPSDITPPVAGTARLFNEGGLIEHCIVKVNDANYPYRLICNKFHSSSSQTMRMYKSNDGIHYSFMRDILSEKRDSQISAVSRGNSIKIYTRVWDSAHANRQIGVMYIDLEGNITTKLHIVLGDNLYAASASQIDLDRELLLPTWYVGVNTSTQQDAHLECYVMDGEKSKKLDTNINQVMKSDEYWALFCSGMISVNGQQYVAMNVWKRHHYTVSGDIQQMETRLVPISVTKLS